MNPPPTPCDNDSDGGTAEESYPARSPQDEARLAMLVRAHFDFVWRSLRRRGLPAEAADDAAQQVFVVLARRLGDVQPGAERSFLYQTATRVGLDAQRAWMRRHEHVHPQSDISELRDHRPSPEEEAHRRQSLALLDELVSSLAEELRTPFVLFELEGLEMKEIAVLLEIPIGTVASRLRTAREEFHAAAKRLRARQATVRRSP